VIIAFWAICPTRMTSSLRPAINIAWMGREISYSL
jgi:hypothetical protein